MTVSVTGNLPAKILSYERKTRKFQLQCSTYNHADPSISDGNNFGENEFNKEFVRNVNKILPVKKGQTTAERVVAFIATFVNYCRDKGTLENHKTRNN